jgi:hypothetical protein
MSDIKMDEMSDTVSDTVSDTMSVVISDTISNSSNHSISDELQQEIQDAIIQYQHIEQLHTDILDRLTQLREIMADTIYITYDGYNIHELDTILTELYQDALKQVETTGYNPFGTMLLSAFNNAEFKYSLHTI